MITPIRAMTISQICERENDLLVSTDDIRKMAARERSKAIDDFAQKLCEAFGETDLKNYGYYPDNVVRMVATQLKGGKVDG